MGRRRGRNRRQAQPPPAPPPEPTDPVVDGSSIAFLEHQIREFEAIAKAALEAKNFAAASAARDKIGPLRNELVLHRRMEEEQQRREQVIAELGTDPAWQPGPTGGRPSKLTPELAAELFRLLRQGMGRARAAERVGIGIRTLQGWLAEGEKADEGRFLHFLRGVLAAEAECQDRATKAVYDLLDPEIERNPKTRLAAASLILRFKFSDDFSQRTRVESTGKDGGPIKHEHDAPARPRLSPEEVGAMSDDEVRRLLGIVEEAQGDGNREPV